MALTGLFALGGCDKPADKGASPYDSHGAPGDGGDNDGGNHGPPRPCGGTYNVLIRGDYQGGGTATVSATSVSISAQVTDSKGETGTLSFSGTLVNQRFNGTGSVMGSPATVSGRVDPADVAGGHGAVLNSVRLVGTLSTPENHVARIAAQ